MDDPKLQELLKLRDTSKFSTDFYIKKVEKPWGYELIFTPDNIPYTGKIIHISEGKRLSLQVHDVKMESWYVMKGKAGVVIEDNQGKVSQIELEEGKGFTTAVGQKHRLVGITDTDIIEVSTPEAGNTYRLEDDYARPTETEEMRKDPNRGWKGS